MSSSLIKKPIVDKNGKQTTVHVRADGAFDRNARNVPAPFPQGAYDPEWSDDPQLLQANINDSRQALSDKLTELIGKDFTLTYETVQIQPEKNNPTRYPGFTAVDVNFTMNGEDSNGAAAQIGASLIFRATDVHLIEDGYRGVGDWLPEETKSKVNAIVDAALPEFKAYHDALFESINKRQVDPVSYVTNAAEARAFLLEFAGYEPWHDQNNERLVGMSHKIASIERIAHKMPEVFAAVEILEAAGELHIQDYSESRYTHNRAMYARIRASE